MISGSPVLGWVYSLLTAHLQFVTFTGAFLVVDSVAGPFHILPGLSSLFSPKLIITFEQDVLLAETEPMIRRLAEKVWAASRKESRFARTVVLKLKTSDFKSLTRRCTPFSPPASCDELINIALSLRERVGLDSGQHYRLIGVGLSNFREPEDSSGQSALFA